MKIVINLLNCGLLENHKCYMSNATSKCNQILIKSEITKPFYSVYSSTYLNPWKKAIGYFTEVHYFGDVLPDESIRILIGYMVPKNSTICKNKKKFPILSLYPNDLHILFHFLSLLLFFIDCKAPTVFSERYQLQIHTLSLMMKNTP